MKNKHWLLTIVLLLLAAGCRTQAESKQEPQPTLTPTAPALTAVEVVNSASVGCENPFPEQRNFNAIGWPSTNFCRHSVPYEEIRYGGRARDGIPSIDRPVFQTVDETKVWLADVEPVLVLSLEGDHRAYPLQVLVWHEIVNDIVAGRPVVITYCPLCNAGLVFERTVGRRTLEFGTTGALRHADLIMYDRQTESWWQQFTGEAVVGELTGQRLTNLASSIVSFGDFSAQFPDGLVLFPETGYEMPYGETPYVYHDALVDKGARFFDGPLDPRLPPKMHVLALTVAEVAVAYPFGTLSERGVVNDEVAGRPLAIFWKGNTASALYGPIIAESRPVGSAAAFERNLDGTRLTFDTQGETFVDRETGSWWNIFGTATDGPYAGRQLTPVSSNEFLWFAWAAFHPETQIYGR